jgi:hypothetical protein
MLQLRPSTGISPVSPWKLVWCSRMATPNYAFSMEHQGKIVCREREDVVSGKLLDLGDICRHFPDTGLRG